SLIVLDSVDYYDAIRTRIQPRYVISQGKIITCTTPAATNFSLTGIAENPPSSDKSVSLSKFL
ncbi:MAG: cytosine deaminase, partial [Rivularia sp. ALOHA_DT_140]|nr:cytosine deaminase [Rivularia sp. ALOHA_DT_140]